MQETPCLGTWIQIVYAKNALGAWKNAATVWHPVLWRRLSRVMGCQSFSVFSLWCLDCFKNNQAYYFVVVTGITAWDPGNPVMGFRPGWSIASNLGPICFFLGKFPVYWVLQNRGLGYAHDATMLSRWPMGMQPNIPERYNPQGPAIFQIDRDRWIKYVSPDAIAAWENQPRVLQGRRDWVIECARKAYDKERPGFSLFPTDRQPQFSEVPEATEEVSLPTPEAPMEGGFEKIPTLIEIEYSQDPASKVLQLIVNYTPGA